MSPEKERLPVLRTAVRPEALLFGMTRKTLPACRIFGVAGLQHLNFLTARRTYNATRKLIQLRNSPLTYADHQIDFSLLRM